MRILIVTETLTAGGAETFVVRLANALARDHRVTIAVMIGERTNPALAAHIDPAVEIEQLIQPAARWLWKIDGAARRLGADASIMRCLQRRWLEKLIRRIQPDIAHSHLFKADRLVTESRRAAPMMRHVITLHGDYAPFLSRHSNPQMLKLDQWMGIVLSRADSIVAICAEHEGFIRYNFPIEHAKTRVIYNGFEPWSAPQPAAKRPMPPVIFCMASRGVPLKGWAKAIAAFGQLKPGTAELVLVGEGEYLDQLKAGPLPKHVRFVGFSPNPVDWIAQSHVGLLPSEFPHESLPTAVMEYLYCDKPVIATDVGEIATMMAAPDGDLAGILLPFDGTRISVADLTAAMQAYVDDPSLRARHAGLCAAAFEKFDMGRCAAAYAALYAEVASNSSTKASH